MLKLLVLSGRHSHLSYLSHFKILTSSLYERKNATFSNISFCSRDIPVFEICKLAKWWWHILNWILINYDGKRYLIQFVSEMLDSLRLASTTCTSQYVYTSFVTMATYWVPDLPDTKRFAGHLCAFCFDICQWFLICIIQQAYTYDMLCPVCSLSKCFLNIKWPKIMKSDWGDWTRVSCHGNQIFYGSRCVACRTIILPWSLLKLTEIGLFIYLMLYWVEWMTSSALSFDYFTPFSNWITSETIADVSKLLAAFLVFPGILCDNLKMHGTFDHSSTLNLKECNA